MLCVGPRFVIVTRDEQVRATSFRPHAGEMEQCIVLRVPKEDLEAISRLVELSEIFVLSKWSGA